MPASAHRSRPGLRAAVGGLAVALSAALAAPAAAQPAQYVERTMHLKPAFRTKRDWHVTAYAPKEVDADPDVPVRVCFWHDASRKAEDCTKMVSGRHDADMIYSHQYLREFSTETLLRGDRPLLGVKCVSEFSAGGSGTLGALSIWLYDAEADEFSRAALIEIGELSEYKIIDEGPLQGSIVTASGLWQTDEGHFGDHRFWIQLYRYGDYYKDYRKVIGFTTLRKYPSEDVRVIDRELGTLEKLMKFTYGDKSPVR